MVADLTQPTMPLVYVNPAFEQITGYSAQEAVGKSPRYLWGSDRSQPEVDTLVEALRNCEEAQVTLRNYRKDGSLFWNELRVAPIFDHRHQATHYLGVMRDVTDSKPPVAAHLDDRALCEPVTGLLDRASFKSRLQALIDGADRGAFLLVKIDVIDFHAFNTSFGYGTGDALLREIADRLRRLPGALVGRVGADEFAIALPRPAPAAAAKAIVQEMHEALEAPYTLPIAMLNVRFALGYTVGVKQHPAVSLMREGTVALHEAKRSGRRLTEYDEATHSKLQVRGRLTSALQRAIANQEFHFHFQPKVELATGRLVGAEGFVRWSHPAFGDQSPGQVLSLAEETGLVLPISQWALSQIAAFAARCNVGRGKPLPIAFRVSPVDLGRFDLLRRLQEVTREFGIEPGWLTLGLAQNAFVQSGAEIVPMLRQIRDMGFGVSIDNFGIHFASAEYLHRLPVSEIKIHRGFVKGMMENRFHRVAVESVIRLGEALGADVTARGVDTAAEAKALRDLSCPIGQGVHLGEPMTEAAFLALANRQVLERAAVS